MTPLSRHPRQRQRLALGASLIACLVLVAVESGLSQDTAPSSEARLAELRKDPQRYAQLVQDAKTFFALPSERQEALRKLDRDLHKLNRGERARLMHAMKRHADWLDKLSPEERAVIVNAPDKQTRLHRIKEQREREWLAHQPKAIRLQLEKLPRSKPIQATSLAGTLATLQSSRILVTVASLFVDGTEFRAAAIKQLKQDEAQRARDWLIASRFWQDLAEPDLKKRPVMPAHVSDFGPQVEEYVNEYLRPILSKEEVDRLKKAEGHWPLYPMTLVELADKHPLALPSAHGPTSFKDLPADIKKKVHMKKGKLDLEQFFNSQAQTKDVKERVELVYKNATKATRLACAVATFLHAGKVKQLPYELWAAKPSEMAPPMQAFLDPHGPFLLGLSRDERDDLVRAEGKWPEYAVKVQQLANKYGFDPPWQSLPEPVDGKHAWDKYRITRR